MAIMLRACVLLVIVMIPAINGAICSDKTGNTCVQTDVTSSTCDAATKICNCKDDFLPIPSGCAEKPMKPSVTLESGRINYVIVGMNATLKCSTNETSEGNVEMSFEWKKGDRVTEVSSEFYNITSANSEEVGHFRCKVKFRGANMYLESDYSDVVELKLYNETMQLSPAVAGLPSWAVLDGILNPTCAGIPYGVTYKFQINTDKTVEPPMNFSLPLSQSTMRCVLNDPPDFKFQNSSKYGNATSMPKVAIGIRDIGFAYSAIDPNLVFNIGTLFVVQCIVPEWAYASSRSVKIKYTFTDHSNPSPVTVGNKYTVPSDMAVAHMITCIASDGTNKNESQILFVKFSNIHTQIPILSVNKNPVSAGSQLLLTCSSSERDKIHITWYKDDVVIFRQHDHIIQFGNISYEDHGKYSCFARKHNYIVKSNDIYITITSSSTIGVCSALWMIATSIFSFL